MQERNLRSQGKLTCTNQHICNTPLTIYSRYTFRKDDPVKSHSILAAEKTSSAPSPKQVFRIKPTTQGIDFISNPCLLPTLQSQGVYIDVGALNI